MKSLFFDANALVYWVYAGSPFHASVKSLVREATERACRLYVLASSLNEVYYALHSHYLSEEASRTAIEIVASAFDLVDLTGQMVFQAIGSDESDYEDGLVRIAAESLQVDAIVSYDKKAFRKSFIPKLDADEARTLLEESDTDRP